jgi:hypothetical protein
LRRLVSDIGEPREHHHRFQPRGPNDSR